MSSIGSQSAFNRTTGLPSPRLTVSPVQTWGEGGTGTWGEEAMGSVSNTVTWGTAPYDWHRDAVQLHVHRPTDDAELRLSHVSILLLGEPHRGLLGNQGGYEYHIPFPTSLDVISVWSHGYPPEIHPQADMLPTDSRRLLDMLTSAFRYFAIPGVPCGNRTIAQDWEDFESSVLDICRNETDVVGSTDSLTSGLREVLLQSGQLLPLWALTHESTVFPTTSKEISQIVTYNTDYVPDSTD
ncbi:hypothetical protein C8Q80DRAFT_1122632 [Daedaleopsis nitida]|nr:hypothetical protein C8Q80DRAFT_1122632 [Daedaleopsis nitida]